MNTSNEQTHACEERVRPPHGWHSQPCSVKNAKYFEGGKWYCGIHAPSKIRERNAKKEEQRRTERDIRRAKLAVQDKRIRDRQAQLELFPELVEILTLLSDWYNESDTGPLAYAELTDIDGLTIKQQINDALAKAADALEKPTS